MGDKTVDLNKSLFELTEQYPGLVEILFNLGFAGVKNPAMRESHGKVMTLKAGCSHMGLDPAAVKAALETKGFKVTG